MPVLDISDESGAISANAAVLVQATMAHPKDKLQRLQYLAVLIARACIENPKSHFPRSLIPVLMDAPPGKKILETVAQTGNSGDMAAEVLSRVLRCSVHHPKHASVLKAVEVVSKLRQREKRRGAKLSASSAKILREWKEYKSVAHLWLTLAAFRQQKAPNPLDPRNELLIPFLGMSEALRMQGEGVFAHGQRARGKPVLDPSRTWRTPDNLPLPETPLSPEPLSANELAILEAYRAPIKH